jgi:hypothetical protein
MSNQKYKAAPKAQNITPRGGRRMAGRFDENPEWHVRLDDAAE